MTTATLREATPRSRRWRLGWPPWELGTDIQLNAGLHSEAKNKQKMEQVVEETSQIYDIVMLSSCSLYEAPW